MFIKRSQDIPHVMRRAIDAFRGNDPIGMPDVFALLNQTRTEDGVSAACRWSLRPRETGAAIDGVCHNHLALDPTERKVPRAGRFCSLLESAPHARSH